MAAALLGGVAGSPAAGQIDVAPTDRPTPVAAANQACLDCHGQPHIATLPPADRRLMVSDEVGVAHEGPPTRPGLYLDVAAVYRTSVHGGLTCVSCHLDGSELPHPARLEPARCDACHETEWRDYRSSVHAIGLDRGDANAATCSDCHGTHDMLSSRNVQSRTHKLQLPFTCAQCHTNPRMMEEGGVHQPLAAQQYIDSMHGRGLIEKGLIVAPSCNDCHGTHRILPSEDPMSTIHRDNVPATCGHCHVGVERIYEESIHGQLLAAGDERGPVCATCHSAHEIVHPADSAFKLRSDERCGQCHADRLARYRETFHGKAIALGRSAVAACYDCHGHHDIVGLDDPASRLVGERRVETCQQCHPDGGENFAAYIAHADHTDRENYPALYWTFVVMTALVIGTFTFFGVHTALWLARSSALYLRDPRAFRHQKLRAVRDDEQYVRFRPFERFLHGLVVSSFLLLVATGMPLKFFDTGWAQVMIDFMGGLEVAGALHRAGAIITFIYFALHLGSLALAAVRHRSRFRNPETKRFDLRQAWRVAFSPEMPLPTLT
ncbi:MAG: hypothetical protein HKO59_09360, partial [Phycisphaerales bacterium]|nr:hypothetical protein [Phycisphaerae bacterium]NNM26177.1 hypothetical protein [Phycisphaerales bacterium]